MAHLIDTLGDAGVFTTLVLGLQKTGLATLLEGAAPYTIFAPPDPAFEQLSDDVYISLFENIQRLTCVLQFHIVSGIHPVSHLLTSRFLENLRGHHLSLHPALRDLSLLEETAKGAPGFIPSSVPAWKFLKNITIDSALITYADIQADNGIIHTIDRIFLSSLTFLSDQQEDLC